MKVRIKKRKVAKVKARPIAQTDIRAMQAKYLQAIMVLVTYSGMTRKILALSSIKFFAWCYFGIVLSRAQERWAQKCLRSKKACILAPRGHGKTEMFSKILVIWLLCRNRDVRILLTSYTDRLAKKNLSTIKLELEINKKLVADFGMFYSRENTWDKHMIYVIRNKIMKDPTVEAIGLNGFITGGRFDVIILDDIVSIKTYQSGNAEMRAKVIEILESEIEPLLDKGGRIWAIGTRKHFGDIYAQFIKNMSWNVLKDKAIIREPAKYIVKELEEAKIIIIDDEEVEINYEIIIEGDDSGECLWPEYFSMEALLAIKHSIASQVWNREYQNEVMSDEYALFKMKDLKACCDDNLSYINSSTTFTESIAAKYGIIVQGVDPALVTDVRTAEAHDTSFFVDMTIGGDYRGNCELIYLDRARGLKPSQVEARITANCLKFTPFRKAIESNSFGSLHIANLVEKTDLPIVKHHTGGNKRDPYKGVPSLAIMFENRKIKLPYKTPEDRRTTDSLLEELHAFGSGEHTDQVMALWIVMTLYSRVIVLRRRSPRERMKHRRNRKLTRTKKYNRYKDAA